MRGSVRRKGRWYYLVIKVGGRNVWRALKTDREEEAWKRARERLIQIDARTYREGPRLRFEEFAGQYVAAMELEVGKGALKPSTLAGYRSYLSNHILPFFGPMRLDRIDPQVGRFFLQELGEKVARGALSAKSYNNCLRLLSRMFEWGRQPDRGLVATNPIQGQKLIRVRRAEMSFLGPAEINRLLGAVREPYRTLFLLAVTSGLRLGELLGLTWQDLDLDAGRIQVRRGIWRGMDIPTKSEHSDRVVDLPQETVQALRRYREAFPPGGRGWVFRASRGTTLDGDNLRKRVWEAALRRAGLPHVRIHDLRHTYASLMIAVGAHIKYLTKQMGHSSVAFTLDRYGHLLPEVGREALKGLDRFVLEEGGGERHEKERTECYDPGCGQQRDSGLASDDPQGRVLGSEGRGGYVDESCQKGR